MYSVLHLFYDGDLSKGDHCSNDYYDHSNFNIIGIRSLYFDHNKFELPGLDYCKPLYTGLH